MIAIFPEIASCAVSGDVERLAILARIYFGDDQAKLPVVDMTQLLSNAGIGLTAQNLNYYAAVVAKDDQGHFEISVIYRDDLVPEEVRFNLAHCLGHILIDIQPKVATSANVKMGFKEDHAPIDRYCGVGIDAKMPPEYQKKEEMADQFAAALLMPKAMLERTMEKIEKLEHVAKFFKVTTGCLERRLEDIGYKMREPENFIEAERNFKGFVDDAQSKRHILSDLELKQSLDVHKNIKSTGRGYSDKVVQTKAPFENKTVTVGNMEAKGNANEGGMSRIREIAKMLDGQMNKSR